MKPLARKLSSAQVSRILQRASEIDVDSGRDGLTVSELRRIAHEAGIDPAAVDMAVAETFPERSSESGCDVGKRFTASAHGSHLGSEALTVGAGATCALIGFIVGALVSIAIRVLT